MIRFVVIIFLLSAPFVTQSQVTVKKEGKIIILENGLVRAVFKQKEKLVGQEYFAKEGNAWKLIAESFGPPAQYPANANQLLNSSITKYRYLASMAEGAAEISRSNSVIISGELNNIKIKQIITLEKNKENFHVDVEAVLPGKQDSIEYLLSTYRFIHEGAPSFVHTPTLKYNEERWETPAEQQILGDRSFHSPAVVLQEKKTFFSLVPDLDAINKYRVLSPDARRTIDVPRNQFSVPLVESKYTMPTALDMNIRTGLTPGPIVSYGFIDNIIQHHIRYLHPNDGTMVRTVSSPELKYSFDLFISANKNEGRGFQDITSFIWKKYGHPAFIDHKHLVMPFPDYVKTISGVTFYPMEVQPPVDGYKNTGSFLEFEMNGVPVGGFRSAVPGWTDALWNSVFWNNARDAVGMYLWGKRLHDNTYLDRARRTVNLILASPQNKEGLFPLIYRAKEKKWQSASYDIVSGKYGLFSAGPESKTYDVVAMSKTCAHLLDYYQRCEQDKKIIEFTAKYADWLSDAVDENGMLVSYISTGMQPSDILKYSAQPASSMWFLSEIYRVTKKKKYLQAAERIASFLQREIIPLQRWIDLEQYFSCGIKSLSFKGDSEQGQLARGNLSVGWAAEGFASLYKATNNDMYLKSGESCIDYLTFTQCSWNPHYIYTAYPFGGFSVDNSDHATYLDARQAEYVKPLIWYGKQLGRSDLVERGVAAARASVVLINHPLHKMNGIYEYTNIYTFGLGPENIDHEGHPQSAMRTHASWGEGSGIFTGLSDAADALEGAYINMKKNIAVGVDGVAITSYENRGGNLYITMISRLSQLEVPYTKPYLINLKIDGNPSKVFINGKEYPVNKDGLVPVNVSF